MKPKSILIRLSLMVIFLSGVLCFNVSADPWWGTRISNLADVDNQDPPTDGDILIWNDTEEMWEYQESTASVITLDTANFDQILSGTDLDVQTAMETIDDLSELNDLTVNNSLLVNPTSQTTENFIYGNPAGNFLGAKIKDYTHLIAGAYIPMLYGMSFSGILNAEVFGMENGIYVVADGTYTDDPIITLYTANLGNTVNISLDESENRLYFDQNGNWACFDDEVLIGYNTSTSPGGILHVDTYGDSDAVLFRDRNGGNLAASLELDHYTASPAAGDDIYNIKYTATNSTPVYGFEYLNLWAEIGSPTAGSESVSFYMDGYEGGVLKTFFKYVGEDETLYLGADGLVNVEGTFEVDGKSTFNAAFDIVNNASDERILLSQTSATGTQGFPFININDDRTGDTANEVNEATIVIDAEGSYALYVLDGNVDFSSASTVYSRGNMYWSGSTNSVADNVIFGWGGTTADFRGRWNANGTGDDFFEFGSTISGVNTPAIVFKNSTVTPNNCTDFDNWLSPTLVLTNNNGADTNDFNAVAIGARDTADIAVANYFDFYAFTGAFDGTPDATTTELASIYRFGNAGTATTNHSIGAGSVLFEDDIEVDGTIYADSNVVIADHIRSATSIYRRYYYLPIASFSPGTSGATWTSADANGTGGWQLNVVGETLEGDVDVHTDWDAASDLEIELYFQINTAANANDTVDLKVVLYYMSPGDSATKTQTVEVATNVGGVGGAAQYTMYKTEFVINYDEVDNVVDAGDIIGFQINLETDTSEVDDIIMNHATFHYSTTHVGIEDGDV